MSKVFTYQTRLPESSYPALDAYAMLYGQVERKLFAAMQSGRGTVNQLKRDCLCRFGITARQFNAVRVGLEGKVASIRERRPELISEAGQRIRKAERVIAKLDAQIDAWRDPVKALMAGRPVKPVVPGLHREKLAAATTRRHHKMRRLAILRHRLQALKSDREAGVTRLCFGSRKLFRAQFNLEENGYASHDEWLADWRRARSNPFFVLGSGDETAGCQGCVARENGDGTLALRLRLPDARAETHGKHVNLDGVRFAYGHEPILAALRSGRRITASTRSGQVVTRRTGTAISYRLLRDEKGWRVFLGVAARPVDHVSRRESGAIGIDVNADHLAIAETDRSGNLVSTSKIGLALYGKRADQARALTGEAAVSIAAQARAAGKSVVLEKLAFQKKKEALEATGPRRARMISSLAYRLVGTSVKSACFRAGVETIEVNPAYTSVTGAVNHARRRGIPVHQGAAYAIARRGLGLSGRPTVRKAVVSARNGAHVTFDLPAQDRSKHVWSFWSGTRARLKAAHAAHARCGGLLAPPPPLPPERPVSCATWALPAKTRHANRHPHCSDGVMDFDDMPY